MPEANSTNFDSCQPKWVIDPIHCIAPSGMSGTRKNLGLKVCQAKKIDSKLTVQVGSQAAFTHVDIYKHMLALFSTISNQIDQVSMV